MRIVVATHGHCFDGLASAALFSHFAGKLELSAPDFEYRACTYGPTQPTPSSAMFDGDQNAMLDFQFSPNDNLTWYFDHHATAFPNSAMRDAFEAKRSTGRYHFDPRCSSCATLIGRTMTSQFGLSLDHLSPLAELADRVDSAKFESPRAAIDRSTPLSRFVALVERYGDDAFLNEWVPRLLARPVGDVARHPDVERRFAAIEREQRTFTEHLKARAIERGSVVYADLTDRVHSTFAKFVAYALFPKSVYSVVLGRIPGAMRLAVGYNPWSGLARRHNLGALCQAHGGGGHAVVGGVAFALDATEKAREVALSVVRALEEE
ncbi:MAG: hypothetical protein QM784_02185 [Polyangiaceae bacterium]